MKSIIKVRDRCCPTQESRNDILGCSWYDWEASRRLPLTQDAAMAIRIENRSGHLVRGVDCYGG